MKHIIRIQSGIAQLEYRQPADCVELRLYLLSLMHECARQYQEIKDKRKAALAKAFKELKNLYKSFSELTLEPGRNYKVQFEFVKTLITGQVEKITPALQLSSVA